MKTSDLVLLKSKTSSLITLEKQNLDDFLFGGLSKNIDFFVN